MDGIFTNSLVDSATNGKKAHSRRFLQNLQISHLSLLKLKWIEELSGYFKCILGGESSYFTSFFSQHLF